MLIKKLLPLLLSILFVQATVAQQHWALKLNKDDIKVYTKNLDNSPYKAVKTECTLVTSLSKLTAVLLDIDKSTDWVYSTKSVKVLKQVSPTELYYHSEIAVPWPVNNRDFIVRLAVTQDPATKVVTMLGENQPRYLPDVKGVVRIPHSYSKWVLYPLSNGRVKIEYVLEVNPGGSIPAWLINLFATRGPYETFQKLKTQVSKPMYASASSGLVKD